MDVAVDLPRPVLFCRGVASEPKLYQLALIYNVIVDNAEMEVCDEVKYFSWIGWKGKI